MQIKKELRKKLKAKRKNLEKKAQSDEFIRENLICSDLYLESKHVLFYAGLDDEINLDECINDALLLGKKAALPVCTDDSGNMEFYYITGILYKQKTVKIRLYMMLWHFCIMEYQFLSL